MGLADSELIEVLDDLHSAIRAAERYCGFSDRLLMAAQVLPLMARLERLIGVQGPHLPRSPTAAPSGVSRVDLDLSSEAARRVSAELGGEAR